MNIRILTTCLSLIVLLTVSACQTTGVDQSNVSTLVTGTEPDQLIPDSEKVMTGQFENGMTYVIRRRSKPEDQAELRLLVKVGSLQEEDDQLGHAHYVEHMAFNGTEDFPKDDLIRFAESIGMTFGDQLNAHTSFNYTTYELKIPTADDNLEKGIRILENWAHKLSFDPEEVEKERGVILEEWRHKDSSSERMRLELFPTIFKNTKYAERYPVLGNEESIRNTATQDLIEFYKTWYQPQHMAIVAIGDFNRDDVKKYLEQYLASIPVPENPSVIENYRMPDNKKPVASVATDPEAKIAHISFRFDQPGHPTETFGQETEQFKTQLFVELLQQRMKNVLREANASENGITVSFSNTAGRNLLRLTIGANRKSSAAATFLLDETYRAAQHGFTEQEFDTVKNIFLNQLGNQKKGITNNSKLVNNYTDRLIEDEPLFDDKSMADFRLEILNNISLSEINRTASDWLQQKENRVAWIDAPDSQKESLPSEQELISLWNKASNSELIPYKDSAVADQLMDELPTAGHITSKEYNSTYKAHVWELSNGARVIVKRSEVNSNEVLFQAFSKGGFGTVSDEDYQKVVASSKYTADMGVADFSTSELKQFLSDKAINFRSQVNDRTERFYGKATPEDLENLMQLVHLKFTAMSKDEDYFESLKSRDYKNRKMNLKNPVQNFYRVIEDVKMEQSKRFVSNYAYEPLLLANMDSGYEFYQERFANAADFTFVFVGYFRYKQLENLVNTYIASLPGDPQNLEPWPETDNKRSPGHKEVHIKSGINKMAKVKLEIGGPDIWTPENWLILETIELSLKSLLRDKIREQLGGTYNITVKGDLFNNPLHRYLFEFSFDCEPERVDELVNALRQELHRIKTEGLSQEQVDIFKLLYAASRKKSLRYNEIWRNQLPFINDEESFMLIDELVTDTLKNITLTKVNSALKVYLNGTDTLYATLLPEDSDVELKTINSENSKVAATVN